MTYFKRLIPAGPKTQANLHDGPETQVRTAIPSIHLGFFADQYIPHLKKLINFDLLFALLFAIVYFIVNYQWLKLNRFDGILDIDEAGFTGLAVSFMRQLEYGGINAWLHTFTFPTIQAPISYAVASIIMSVTTLSRNAGLVTAAVFGSIATIFIFMLSSRLTSRLVAAVITFAVISNPYFTIYARHFEFSAASAASFAGFVYFFEKSDSLTRTIPSLLCGVFAGLLLLSRTVNIAFAPAIALSSFVYVISTKKRHWRDIAKNSSLSMLTMLLVSYPWYYYNAGIVFNYLFSYGYGPHAKEYTSGHGGELVKIIAHAVALIERMFLPHIAMLLVMLIIYTISILVKWKFALRDKATLFSIYLVGLFFSCFATLLTSNNLGSGFDVPLLPLLTIGLSVGIVRVVSGRWLKAIMGATVVIICFGTFAPQVDDKLCLRLANDLDPRWHKPASRLVSCGGPVFEYLHDDAGLDQFGTLVSMSGGVNHVVEKQWLNINERVTSKILDLNKRNAPVVFAARHLLLNVNTVQLSTITDQGLFFNATQIDTAMINDDIDGYINWLSQAENESACVFVATTSAYGQFSPAPSYQFLEAAFTQTGLTKAFTLPLPDSRQEVVLWTRPSPRCQ